MFPKSSKNKKGTSINTLLYYGVPKYYYILNC